MKAWLLGGLGLCVFVCLAAACGTEEGDDGEGGSGAESAGSGNAKSSGGGTKSNGSGTFTCCINDTNYTCPNEAALDKCAGFDIDGCMQACSPMDFECQDACFAAWTMSEPDPSDCNEDPEAQCGVGACFGDKTGSSCDIDADCSTLNCFESECYETAPGNPCDIDADCSSLNCYQSCCYGTDTGDPCDIDADCASLNCFENVCQSG